MVNDTGIYKEKKVKVTSNLKLYPWQTQVIRELDNHWKGSIHVVKSKRQCGKSTMLETILVQTAINKTRSVSICLSPTLEQSRKVFKEVKNVIQPTKLYCRHNDLQLYIELNNHSQIIFKSAEQKVGLKGYTVTGIYVVDEAAYIPDDIFFDTLAWVNVSQAPVVICSTPFHKTGFFYKYYNLGFENGNQVYSYNWSEFDTSALLPDEKLEQYRRELPAAKFKTEFLGEFLDNESGVFGDYSGIILKKTWTEFDKKGNCYFGIDWGTGSGGDETAIAVYNSDREMIALYHFNDKDETETINYIIELIKKHQPLKVQVENNSIGAVFYGLLDKAIKAAGLTVMLLRFTTTNESKERLINNFQVLMQRKEVTILDDSTLLTQMDMYEMKVNQNGKHIYNAASGFHDDCIIAMLLAVDCITKGTYIIR